MKHEFAYEEAQRHLKQRNRCAALAGVLGLTTVLAVGAAATREEAVILVPITSERIELSNGGTQAHYLELVTRDTALTRASSSSPIRRSPNPIPPTGKKAQQAATTAPFA